MDELKDLDKWIAENVMGWHSEFYNLCYEEKNDHSLDNWTDCGGRNVISVLYWQATQDIKQAFECLNTWKKAGSKRYYRICGLEGGGYEVNLFEDGIGKVSKHSLQNEIATEYSGELPLAICLAIKKGET